MPSSPSSSPPAIASPNPCEKTSLRPENDLKRLNDCLHPIPLQLLRRGLLRRMPTTAMAHFPSPKLPNVSSQSARHVPIAPNTLETKPTHGDASSPTPGRSSIATSTSSNSALPTPEPVSLGSLPRAADNSSSPRSPSLATIPRRPCHPVPPSCSPPLPLQTTAPIAILLPSTPHTASPPYLHLPTRQPRVSDHARVALMNPLISWLQVSPLQNARATNATMTGYVSYPYLHPISHHPQSHPRGRPLDVDVHNRSHLPSPHLALQPTLAPPRHSNAHPHSRSSSRSSQRSLSIDEMLLEASTDDPRPRGEPQSPRAVIAHHQHPNHAPTPNSQRSIVNHVSGSAPGPLEQPGEQRMYQTHIFAPPVTGAPIKKGKPGSTVGISASFDTIASCGADIVVVANGSGSLPAPPLATTAPPPPTPTTAVPHSATAPAPAAIPHHTPYPPTNAQGQRICRQCGLAGRYKDGKCVEKWGPGPEGPGTVCDRCRKKMKRVERRGTIESQNQSQNHIAQQPSQGMVGTLAHTHSMPAHGNRVTRTDTMPVTLGIGSGGTQLIGHATQMPSFISKDRRDRERIPTSSLAPSPSHHPSRQGDSQRDPPSPPAIATLQADDDKPHRRGSTDRGRRPISSGKID